MLLCGHFVFQQYIKNKHHKYNIKFCELCLYPWWSCFNHWSIWWSIFPWWTQPQTAAIVLKRMNPFLKKCYMFTDNYYNSVALTKFLLQKSTYARAHLEKIEKEIQKKLLQKNLKKWDGLEVDIVVLKWKDKRDVLLILIAHTSQIVTISNRLRIGKQKPDIVTDSNNSIWIWLQRPDIALPLRIKKKFEVVQKVGVQILVIFITNAFYLYQKFSSHRELCHLVNFREVIIKNLIGERKKADQWHKWPNFHYPQTIPDGEKKRNLQDVAGNAGRKK